MELSQSALSRAVNVSRQAISELVKTGTLVKNKKNKIDIENDINREYILAKGFSPENLNVNHKATKKRLQEARQKEYESITKKTKLKKPKPSPIRKVYENGKIEQPEDSPEEPENKLDELSYFINTENLTSGEEANRLLNSKFEFVLKEFGTRKKIKDYVEILWKLSQIEKNQMTSDAIRNELVEMKLVESRLFQFLEAMNIQLLEYPESVIEIEFSMFQADEATGKGKVVKMHNKNLSKIIKECIKNITRELKNISKEKELKVDGDKK